MAGRPKSGVRPGEISVLAENGLPVAEDLRSWRTGRNPVTSGLLTRFGQRVRRSRRFSLCIHPQLFVGRYPHCWMSMSASRS